jgi:hypothetical protein
LHERTFPLVDRKLCLFSSALNQTDLGKPPPSLLSLPCLNCGWNFETAQTGQLLKYCPNQGLSQQFVYQPWQIFRL